MPIIAKKRKHTSDAENTGKLSHLSHPGNATLSAELNWYGPR